MEQYIVTGMSCAACQARVEKAVSKVPGVTSCSVSLLTNSMGVEGTASENEIIAAVEKAGYGAEIKGGASAGKTGTKTGAGSGAAGEGLYAAEEDALKDRETPRLKRRLILSVGFLMVLMYITMGHHMLGLPLPAFFNHNHLALTLTQLLLAIIVMIINRKFFISGFGSLLHGAPNMDTLVALGSSVSFGWSLFVFYEMCGMITQGADNMALMDLYHDQLYFESAAMIPALITVGKMLEAMSKGRTTDALKSLMRLAPKTAILLRDGQEVEVGIGEVVTGDIFVVRPGDSIPVDGVVLEGTSAVNESALTGESVPVDKAEGDTVSAATINTSGHLTCRATRVGEDTTLSQIIHMVSDAAATKAPIARIADKVSGVFVPAVIGIAAVVTVGWLLAGQSLAFALARGISVLVISCPCALGLATPVAIMVSNGLGAKNGILFKTSEALENVGKIQLIALDKTGTITSGEPRVTDLVPAQGISENELLAKASAIESMSEHPLARAVVAEQQERTGSRMEQQEHAGGRMEQQERTGSRAEQRAGLTQTGSIQAPPAATDGGYTVTDFRALPGNGLTARVNDAEITGGSGTFIRTIASVPEDLAAKEMELSAQGKTPLFFAENGSLLGLIAVADVIRPDSPEAIRALRNMGIEVIMLTGDNEKTARAIGVEAGVSDVIAGVLPDGKEAVIRDLQKRGSVAMVGDGINDAPALTRAEIGIAIGAGTDVAIDSADIVLMNSSLSDVAAAVRLGRATLRNIHENLFWAFFYNVICIPLAAGLFAWKMNPMIGAAAMSLSSFTVCMNALRLNLFKMHDASHDKPMRKRALPAVVPGSEAGSERAYPSESSSSAPGAVNDKAGNAADRTTDNTVDAAAEKNTANAAKNAADTTADTKVKSTEGRSDMTATVKIEGMMCGHCEATVKKAMEKLPFVESAEVSHEKGTAVLTLSGPADEAAIKEAIEDRDYKYLGLA